MPLGLGLLAEVLWVKLVGVGVVPSVAVDADNVDKDHVVRREDNVGAGEGVAPAGHPAVDREGRVEPQGLVDDLVQVGKVLDAETNSLSGLTAARRILNRAGHWCFLIFRIIKNDFSSS